MTALPNPSTGSVEEYFQLEESHPDVKYEYLDGHIRMLAGGTANHAIISVNLAAILHNALRGTPCIAYSSDMRVRLSEERYVYPDLSVSCDPQERGTTKTLRSPRLVAEVLSPGTEDIDRGKKFTSYRDCPTIQEYMLVNTNQQMIEVFRRERNNLWSYIIFSADEEVELSRLGVHFSVADVYEGALIPENE